MKASNSLILLIVFALSLASAAAQRAIPDDNLAYPVLITFAHGNTGSGFFLNSGKAIYLVTAKHVLFDPNTHVLIETHADLLSYSKDPSDPTTNRLSLDLAVLLASGNVKPHPSRDVAVIRLFDVIHELSAATPVQPPASNPHQINSTPPVQLPIRLSSVPGVQNVSTTSLGIVGANIDIVKTFDQVLIGNEVILFGYPSSLALQQLHQLDPYRPLLRKGIVAGTNPQNKSIILDCPVYFGNSGGPVLELDPQGLGYNLRIIGVVDQFVPFIQTGGTPTFAMQFALNSGYSIATPMDFVLELVK